MENSKSTPKQRIQNLATRLGLSLRALAQTVEMSEATLYHITDSSRGISGRTASRICYWLEQKMGVIVNRNWLLTGEGEMIDQQLSAPLTVSEPDVQYDDEVDWKEKYYALLEKYMELQGRILNEIEKKQQS